MNLGLAGRTAVVCGSTSGLGEAIARALGNDGARVVVCGRRGDRAQQIAAELPSAVGVEVDITEPAAADFLIETAEKVFGQVEILVLNGPCPKPTTAVGLEEQDIFDAIDALLLPQFRLVSKVVSKMRDSGWGRILAVGSSGVLAPLAGLATSNVGRSALGACLKTLANEVGRYGVTVNMLIPGKIDTDRITQLDTIRASSSGRTVEEVVA